VVINGAQAALAGAFRKVGDGQQAAFAGTCKKAVINGLAGTAKFCLHSLPAPANCINDKPSATGLQSIAGIYHAERWLSHTIVNCFL
jgi:hypothetical protein